MSSETAIPKGVLRQTYGWIGSRDDLLAGTGVTVMVMPKVLQAMDCSSTGKTLVFRGGSDLDRIDIYRAEGAGFKPAIAFRP